MKQVGVALPHGGEGARVPRGRRVPLLLISGGAVQVHPGLEAVDPTLAVWDFQLLKLKHDKLLSNFACFAFNCNLRHYTLLSDPLRATVVCTNSQMMVG